MGIADQTTGLILDACGVWRSTRSSNISYPETGNLVCSQLEDSSYWFAHRNDCISAVVRRFPPRGCILDVGGGNGFVTKRLLEDGFAATLLEPGAVGARNGKELRQIPEVICATLEDAAFVRESVHAVGCFDVVEHIPDDGNFLGRLHELLTPSGMLYGTVPAHPWLWSQSDDSAQHHRRYTRDRVSKVLDEAGFEVRFFTYFFAPLILPILMFRVVPFRLGLSRGRNLLSDEAEHCTSGGLAIVAVKRWLRIEAGRIARGVESRVGASALFVAQKRK